MKLKTQLVALACSLAVMGSTHAEEEKEIALKDAPKKVQKAIKTLIRLLPDGAKLEELHKETEDEGTIYEAEIEVPGGTEYEVEITAQGKIVEIEMEDEEDDKDDDDDDDDKGDD